MKSASDVSARTLELLEDVIARAGEAIFEAGKALAEIKDRKLHKIAGYKTFDHYLKERWSMSHSRGYQLIDFALMREQIPVASEKEARDLAPAWRRDPQAVGEAFKALCDRIDRRAAVREVRAQFRPAQAPGNRQMSNKFDIDGQMSVYVVVGIPIGQQPPEVRVAVDADAAVTIRDELEASGRHRKVVMVRRDVEASAPAIGVAS